MNDCMFDLQLKYQYVFFNASDGKLLNVDKKGYYYICALDLKKVKQVQLISAPLESRCELLRLLYGFHNSRRINKIVNLPFKSVWYPLYFKEDFVEDKPICFVLNNFQIPFDYILFLKKKYPKARFVKLHRDLTTHFYQRYPDYSKERCEKLFDYSFTYDAHEAEQNGWVYFDEFESMTSIPKTNIGKEYDLFFAGRAKDRLTKLLRIYEKLSSAGIKVNYYLTGVSKEDEINLPGIEYSNRNMSYLEMLTKTINCGCLLDINQGGAVGYTSRFLEAVMYNKKLLTDNPYVKKSKYYNPNYISLFKDENDIDLGFIKSHVKVNHNYNNEFSPIHLIKSIDNILR